MNQGRFLKPISCLAIFQRHPTINVSLPLIITLRSQTKACRAPESRSQDARLVAGRSSSRAAAFITFKQWLESRTGLKPEQQETQQECDGIYYTHSATISAGQTSGYSYISLNTLNIYKSFKYWLSIHLGFFINIFIVVIFHGIFLRQKNKFKCFSFAAGIVT